VEVCCRAQRHVDNRYPPPRSSSPTHGIMGIMPFACHHDGARAVQPPKQLRWYREPKSGQRHTLMSHCQSERSVTVSVRALRRLLHTGPGTRLNGVEGPATRG
jgi:hypothetical protein